MRSSPLSPMMQASGAAIDGGGPEQAFVHQPARSESSEDGL